MERWYFWRSEINIETVWYNASEVFVHLPCPSSNLVYRSLESTLRDILQENKINTFSTVQPIKDVWTIYWVNVLIIHSNNTIISMYSLTLLYRFDTGMQYFHWTYDFWQHLMHNPSAKSALANSNTHHLGRYLLINIYDAELLI